MGCNSIQLTDMLRCGMAKERETFVKLMALQVQRHCHTRECDDCHGYGYKKLTREIRSYKPDGDFEYLRSSL